MGDPGKVSAYFEGIYSTSDLQVSFDGANIMRPTNGPNGSKEYLTRRHWLHVDSDCSSPPELSGYQALVSVSGMDGTDGKGGCFQAVLGSHTDDFRKFNEAGHMVWGSTSTSVPRTHELRQRMSRVIAPDRSLVVWKNEVFHCNSPHMSSRFRYTQYVNFVPSSRVSEETHYNRVSAFVRGVGSTHRVESFWPSSELCWDFIAPNLTPRQKELLGSCDDSDCLCQNVMASDSIS
mmetsp:Transcript_15783/g.26954  ORF Transcript_15783/g.26954 Transcript_15783/m.26954 type:complete len:234 (+) Transcript_15783:549-1250(+)